jgi:cellulose synthase/poly-beta-1,6-N-acetylglucosamine synthase-like glycosyltransferase
MTAAKPERECPEVSVIIPAYNEEAMIGETLRSASHALEAAGLSYEIVVSDHGSTDSTARIAAESGAIVLSEPKAATISVLRNRGVEHSSGDILVFLDADTSLTDQWAAHAHEAVTSLRRNPMSICGSVREAPEDAAMISRYWYLGQNSSTAPTHLGGGHIVTSRAAVLRVGGFPEEYETGEDYEFCRRAQRLGIGIKADPRLRAVHRGVPDSVRAFVAREVWHGRGDLLDFKSIVTSKVAMVSLGFVLLHVLFAVAALAWALGWPGAGSLTMVLCVVLVLGCALTSLVKYRRRSVGVIFFNSGVFYLYYAARAASVLSVLLFRSPRRRVRN